MARYCRRCASELKPGAAVCPNCGHVITTPGMATIGAAGFLLFGLLLLVGVPVLWFGGYFALSIFVSPKSAAIVVSIIAAVAALIIASVWVSYSRRG